MQIHISPRHLTLTAAIHGHVAYKVGHLEDLTDSIIGAHVVLFHDERKNPKKSYVVKVHLAVPGPDIHAEDAEADLYTAIDKVVHKLAAQLRKRKAQVKEKSIREKKRTAELRKRS
jgi:putative sigma-54 modulation protein